jgi:enoyl-CoA hydratase/carnithine racemase
MSAQHEQPGQSPIVIRSDRAGVTTLTLNRPQEFNTLSCAMMSALQVELDAITVDKSIRVVIVAAAGKAFSAGHNLGEMRSDSSRSFHEALFRQCGDMMLTIQKLPQPVIARVHGVAAAAGCQLVATCDLAVAADVARFAVPGVKLGLFCSTPAVALSRNMGRKQALEMLMTGDAIDAHEAQRRGLVNRVVPGDQLDAEVGRLVQSILDKSPLVLAMGKQLFYAQLELGVDDALRLASQVITDNMMTEDAQHGIDCFLEKKTPQWKGR